MHKYLLISVLKILRYAVHIRHSLHNEKAVKISDVPWYTFNKLPSSSRTFEFLKYSACCCVSLFPSLSTSSKNFVSLLLTFEALFAILSVRDSSLLLWAMDILSYAFNATVSLLFCVAKKNIAFLLIKFLCFGKIFITVVLP